MLNANLSSMRIDVPTIESPRKNANVQQIESSGTTLILKSRLDYLEYIEKNYSTIISTAVLLSNVSPKNKPT
jgi:hypothetical protein